jgi:hypothetical protein
MQFDSIPSIPNTYFATVSNDLLAIGKLRFRSAFWWQDITIYLVFSVFTCRPNSLLTPKRPSVFLFIYCYDCNGLTYTRSYSGHGRSLTGMQAACVPMATIFKLQPIGAHLLFTSVRNVGSTFDVLWNTNVVSAGEVKLHDGHILTSRRAFPCDPFQFRLLQRIHGTKKTKSTEQSPSWEADSHPASQEITRLLWNPRFTIVLTRTRRWSLPEPKRI